jgi:hypothetical protein
MSSGSSVIRLEPMLKKSKLEKASYISNMLVTKVAATIRNQHSQRMQLF